MRKLQRLLIGITAGGTLATAPFAAAQMGERLGAHDLPLTRHQALMQLQALHDNLLRYEECAISASALSEQARASGALLDSLPPRYGEVLLALLDRLEASTLAAEESCTFNQQELHDNLYGWVEKARDQLESQPQPL